jgi:hypothetical protein
VLQVESVCLDLEGLGSVGVVLRGEGENIRTSSFGTRYCPSAYAWYRRPFSYLKLYTEDVADIVYLLHVSCRIHGGTGVRL